MNLANTLTEGEKFHRTFSVIKIVLVGLFITATSQSGAPKATKSTNGSNMVKDQKKLVETMAKYSHEALNLTIKSLNIVNTTDMLLKEVGEGIKNDPQVKEFEKAKSSAEATRKLAEKGHKSVKEASNKIKKVADNSKDVGTIGEALSQALKGSEDSRKALKDAKGLSMIAFSLIKKFTKLKKNTMRIDETMRKEEGGVLRKFFDIDKIIKAIQGHLKNAVAHIQSLLKDLTG